MAYRVAIGRVHVWGDSFDGATNQYNCKQARGGCRPAYVFSIAGQVAFRSSLNHLKKCNRMCCRSLRKKVFSGMKDKLHWLMDEHILLGCVQVQPVIYGASRVVLRRSVFGSLAHHLAHCPKESCAQLRRSVLLTIREQVGPQNMPPHKRKVTNVSN